MSKKIICFYVFLLSINALRGSPSLAGDDVKDYAGPFPTEALYALCSQNDSRARDKCDFYIQGLMSGMTNERRTQEKGLSICLPEMSAEAARLRIINCIDGITEGHPAKNKDGGDWMAFLCLATGNTCKK
jgi:hypothetical protein